VAASARSGPSPKRGLQLLGLLHAQLPEFMGGFTDWSRNRRQQGCPGLPQEGVRPGIGVDVAKPLVRGKLQGGVLPERLPGWEDVIGPYLTDKAGHLREVVRPLQEKEETVYVVPGSDAEDHVARRFPLKTIKQVGNRPASPDDSAVLVGAASGVPAGEGGKAERRLPLHVSHGKEPKEATVLIREGTLQVKDGHQGEANLRVTADSETWLGFLAKERSLLWALLRRRNSDQGIAETAGRPSASAFRRE